MIDRPTVEKQKVACPGCRTEYEVHGSTGSGEVKCTVCRKVVSYRLFPRFSKEPPKEERSQLAGGSDATCQFYPEFKAELICDECGCFMSGKASVNWADKTICMPCLHTLREEKGDTGYRAESKIWDNRALVWLALLPITLFTAPVALFLLIRHRKEPRGFVPRSKFRWWLVMILTILILLFWAGVIGIWIAALAKEIT